MRDDGASVHVQSGQPVPFWGFQEGSCCLEEKVACSVLLEGGGVTQSFFDSALSYHSPTKSEFIRAKYQMLAFVHKLPCRDDDGVTAKDLSKVCMCLACGSYTYSYVPVFPRTPALYFRIRNTSKTSTSMS